MVFIYFLSHCLAHFFSILFLIMIELSGYILN